MLAKAFQFLPVCATVKHPTEHWPKSCAARAIGSNSASMLTFVFLFVCLFVCPVIRAKFLLDASN